MVPLSLREGGPWGKPLAREDVEVVDVNNPSKGKQTDMFKQMLERFLDIGCINIKFKVNETMLNATVTESTGKFTEIYNRQCIIHVGTCLHD